MAQRGDDLTDGLAGEAELQRIGDPDDETRVVLKAGEVYLAPTGIWHGDSVFIGDDEYDECWILDVFSPPRDDLRNG